MARLNPEVTYYLDETLTLEDVKEACEYNETLTGRVIAIDTSKKQLVVSLNETLTARMSWEDATIKSLTPKDTVTVYVPPQISSLLHNKIRVKVKSIVGNRIFVSRKANMIEAWNKVKELPTDYVYNAAYIGTGNNGSYVFYDIGEGIVAFCHIRECTTVFVEDVASWFTYGELHKVTIVKLDEPDNYSIVCSRKKCCDKTVEKLSQYDIIDVKVASFTANCAGYHVEVSPVMCGIADLPSVARPIKYGEIVKACVRKIAITNEQVRVNLAIL